MSDIKPIRLQRRRAKGYRLVSPNGLPIVSVTRPGPWGNPFVVGGTKHTVRVGVSRNDDGTVTIHEREFETEVLLHGDAVQNFKTWTYTTPAGRAFVARVKRDLRACNLACYCALDKPCHADVLLSIANGAT